MLNERDSSSERTRLSDVLIIRADASSTIGVGHVMRCIALAQAWQASGGEAVFCSRELPSFLSDRLKDEGFQTAEIHNAMGSLQDANDLVNIARKLAATAVVLDGYQFDSEYQRYLGDNDFVTLLVDDCAELPAYYTDFVLNQNLGAVASRYAGVAKYSELLLGTEFALIRKEFTRHKQKERSEYKSPYKVLVTLGGADPTNATQTVIDGLKRAVKHEWEARVIVGGLHPSHRTFTELMRQDARFEILSNVQDMAEQYAWADIVVAAGGGSNWEMCYFGLPRIVVVIAENQRSIAQNLEESGIALNLGDSVSLNTDRIACALATMLESPRSMSQASRKAIALIDGNGANRIVQHLMGSSATSLTTPSSLSRANSGLKFRKAKMSDWATLLNWRNDAASRQFSRNHDRVSAPTHRAWLRACLRNCHRRLLIAEIGGELVGTVRIDYEDPAEISWTVAPHARGRGFGKLIVHSILEDFDAPIKAVITKDNLPSRRIAESAGFVIVAEDGEWLTFLRTSKSFENGGF